MPTSKRRAGTQVTLRRPNTSDGTTNNVTFSVVASATLLCARSSSRHAERRPSPPRGAAHNAAAAARRRTHGRTRTDDWSADAQQSLLRSIERIESRAVQEPSLVSAGCQTRQSFDEDDDEDGSICDVRPLPQKVDAAVPVRQAELIAVPVAVSAPAPLPPISLARPQVLPELQLPALADTIAEPSASTKDGAGTDHGTDMAAVSAALLSPLKFELPDTPELRAMWSKAITIHDRLRMQLKCKKMAAERRRASSGLDEPIVESPGGGIDFFNPDLSGTSSQAQLNSTKEFSRSSWREQ